MDLHEEMAGHGSGGKDQHGQGPTVHPAQAGGLHAMAVRRSLRHPRRVYGGGRHDPVPLPRDPEIRPSKGQGRSELQKGTGIL